MSFSDEIYTSISGMESSDPTVYPFAHVTNYLSADAITPDGGGGFYFALEPATTPTTNGGTILASDTAGYYWYLTQQSPVSARQFGCTGNGSTDDSAAAQSALNSAPVVWFPAGKYCLNNISIPANAVILTDGDQTVFFRNANGPIFTLGAGARILGGPVFDGNFAVGGYTGNTVEVPLGTVPGLMSTQQLIEHATFQNRNTSAYHLSYTAAGAGFRSKVLFCKFLDPADVSTAAVLWPDELKGQGGDRLLVGCYSYSPLCDVGGCDGGVISDCVIETSSPSLIFPTGTTNPSNSVVVSGNRFLGDGAFTVLGLNHTFSNNTFTANVTIGDGVHASQGIFFDYSNIFSSGGLFDGSAISGVLQENALQMSGSFPSTPGVVSGTVLGTYDRSAVGYVTFSIELEVSMVGSGDITFTIPVLGTNASTFVGIAYAQGYPGIAIINLSTAQISLYDQGGSAPAQWTATHPLTFASGDYILVQGKYKLF